MGEEEVVVKEVIEFSDVLDVMKVTQDFMARTDKLNKRLAIVLIAFIVGATITIITVAGFYFKYAYGFNESMEQQQDGTNQKIERTIN